MPFKIVSENKPKGDQPQAIESQGHTIGVDSTDRRIRIAEAECGVEVLCGWAHVPI